MPQTYLLDTNILIYTYDDRAPEKQVQALELVEQLGAQHTAALPAQVLAEFANVALKHLDPPLPANEVYTQIELYASAFPILPLTPALVLEAVRGIRDHRFAYYDAQIWAAARLNQIPVVLSEDFATGATVEGVTFLDPFASDIDLSDS